MSIFDSRYYVTFTSDSKLTFTVLVGEQSPVIVGGHGGWEVVDRPKRKGMTRFKGKDPYKQDIAIRFDGFLDQISQETDIRTLMRMDASPALETPPPLITLDGFALRTDLTWVIDNIDWDSQNVIWDVVGGIRVRLRQDATVHLMEYVDDNVIITAPSPAVANSPSKKTPSVHISRGQSLKEVAQEVYGDPAKYLPILFANPQLSNDPSAIIPAQTVLSIPPLYGATVTTFVVQ